MEENQVYAIPQNRKKGKSEIGFRASVYMYKGLSDACKEICKNGNVTFSRLVNVALVELLKRDDKLSLL